MAIEHGPKHALDVLTRQCTALLTRLQLRRRDGRNKPGRDGKSDLAQRLVADALVVRAEADLRWLDPCESRLLEGRGIP